MKKPKIEHRLFYEVEVYHTDGPKVKPHWYVRRWNFETLEEAREYIKKHTKGCICPEKFRIVKSETTIARTIVK